ncbi:MAG: nitroreductase family protein [Bacilli bacterium]|nr:nitroreductase family protein [Bacilli bacterium]
MELVETINNRRSIRKYKDIDISNDIVEDLINSARLAPSAKNRQPWEFMIVKNKTKNEIADIMLEQLKESKVSLERKIYNANSSVKATANIMKQAPILILVFKPKEDNWIIGDSLSIGAAIEHICLRATDLELGSLWIRDIVYTQKEIAKLVGKDDMELISAISIGYPDENPKQRPRKNLNEMLEWYKDEK